MKARDNASKDFKPLGFGVLTISDTRGADDDQSGDLLEERLKRGGHQLVARAHVVDEKERIQEKISEWISAKEIDVILTTGGTGLTKRDVTPDALKPLFEKEIEGFSALFHHVSLKTIGISTLLSRACAGVSGKTYIFALPGSPGACRDGWDNILRDILDSRHRPCNLSELFQRL